MFYILVYCNVTEAVDNLQFNNEECYCGNRTIPDRCQLDQVSLESGVYILVSYNSFRFVWTTKMGLNLVKPLVTIPNGQTEAQTKSSSF